MSFTLTESNLKSVPDVVDGDLYITTENHGDLTHVKVNGKIVFIDELGSKILEQLPDSNITSRCGVNITEFKHLPLTLQKIVYKNTPIHNLVKKYDANGKDINLAFLIRSLQLDSDIHTKEDIHPILDILKPEDYKQCSDILSDLNINLNTHSTMEIINIISSL